MAKKKPIGEYKVEETPQYVSSYKLGLRAWTIFHGLGLTIEEAQRASIGAIQTAYRALQQKDPEWKDGVTLAYQREAIMRHLQTVWCDRVAKAPPSSTILRKIAALQAHPVIGEETSMSKTAKKAARVTAASVIRQGLARKWSDEAILKDVAKRVPKSKANAAHIAYYRREAAQATA